MHKFRVRKRPKGLARITSWVGLFISDRDGGYTSILAAVWTAQEVKIDQHAEGLAAQHELDRLLRVLVTARRARERVLLGERARRWGGPPGLTGRDGTATAVAAAREGTAEQ